MYYSGNSLSNTDTLGQIFFLPIKVLDVTDSIAVIFYFMRFNTCVAYSKTGHMDDSNTTGLTRGTAQVDLLATWLGCLTTHSIHYW